MLLAGWLDEQQARRRLAVADTGWAAKMLMDMTFGTVAPKSGAGPEWSVGANRAAYMRQCIHIFLDGVGCR